MVDVGHSSMKQLMVTHCSIFSRCETVPDTSHVSKLLESSYPLFRSPFSSLLTESVLHSRHVDITLSSLPRETMSRHNRRRTRVGPKTCTSYQHATFVLPSSVKPLASKDPNARNSRRADVSAICWQNPYQSWQAREKKEKVEWERMKEERKRIFGGDGSDGEDDGLCWRMMDFFVRLDYL